MQDIQPVITKKARSQGMSIEGLCRALGRYNIQVDYWSLCFLLQHPHKITNSCARAISTILHFNDVERRIIFLRYPS